MSKKLAADYFSRHNSNECFITSDNRVFHDIGAAQSFASGLSDQKINHFTRAEVENDIEVEGAEEVKTFTVEDLKAFDAETANYKEALALAKGLKIDLSSTKKEDVYAALEAEKAKIEA
jgi:hypothetical protein